MALTPEERKQLEELTRKASEPEHVGPRTVRVMGRDTNLIPPTGILQISLIKDLLTETGYDDTKTQGTQSLDLTTSQAIKLGIEILKLSYPDLSEEIDFRYLGAKDFTDLLTEVLRAGGFAGEG